MSSELVLTRGIKELHLQKVVQHREFVHVGCSGTSRRFVGCPRHGLLSDQINQGAFTNARFSKNYDIAGFFCVLTLVWNVK